MARLLVGDTWYDSVRSQSWRERDFEDLVLGQAKDLFPEWRCVSFTEIIVGEDGTRKRADLALIDRQYRQWWVVEIELSHHDLYSHVIPQVDAFRTANYGAAHAQALHRADPDLELESLHAMLRGEPPGVLVIVDTPSTTWRRALEERRVHLAIVEPFRSEGTTVALRLNGDQPEPHPEHLSRCTRHISLRRFWRVHSPAALPTSDSTLSIEVEGVDTTWHIVHLQDSVMLKPDHGDVLGEVNSVDLVQLEAGGLAFRSVSVTTNARRRPR